MNEAAGLGNKPDNGGFSLQSVSARFRIADLDEDEKSFQLGIGKKFWMVHSIKGLANFEKARTLCIEQLAATAPYAK